MADAVIENPILNSPFDEPSRHWKFGDTGITNEIVEGPRVSSYFMPIPASKLRATQLELETQWTRGSCTTMSNAPMSKPPLQELQE